MRSSDAFANYLHWHHHLTPEDVEVTDTPGYWRMKKECGGRVAGCREPSHNSLFSGDGIHHTIYFYDRQRDEHGRFTSPYRTWQAARETAGSQLSEKGVLSEHQNDSDPDL